jgi:hypothetical protein
MRSSLRYTNRLLVADDLKRVAAAAVAKCHLDDGVRDGVIGNPFRCKVDPGELACESATKDWCLKPPQVDAVRKLYTGSRDSQGTNLTARGLLPGSEDFAAAIYIPTDDHRSSDGLIENGLRDVFFWPEAGPGWTSSSSTSIAMISAWARWRSSSMPKIPTFAHSRRRAAS